MGFPDALEILLKHEGGFVNHPKDPGGATNLGVTKRVWERWIGRRVSVQEIKDLTPERVAPLYKKRYWDKVHADELPWGLALQVFDFGVNAGPRRAIRTLQKTVGTLADGLYGPMTRKAIDKYVNENGLAVTITEFASNRMKFYKSLKTYTTFGRGWSRRTHEVRNTGLEWVETNAKKTC